MFNLSLSPHSKKAASIFQSQQKFKEEQNFPWGACLSAGRAIVKRELKLSEAREREATILRSS